MEQDVHSGSSEFSGEDGASSPTPEFLAGIEDCLNLIEQVWPPGVQSDDDLPRRLGRFTIVREIGRGGFGVVFLAEDPDLGRQVALKIPRIEVLSHGQSWRRFVREAQAAARLDHPNL